MAGFNFSNSKKIVPYKRTSKVNSICAVVGRLLFYLKNDHMSSELI